MSSPEHGRLLGEVTLKQEEIYSALGIQVSFLHFANKEATLLLLNIKGSIFLGQMYDLVKFVREMQDT